MTSIAQPATRRLAMQALEREARQAELIRLPDIVGGHMQPIEARERAAKARQLKRLIESLGK